MHKTNEEYEFLKKDLKEKGAILSPLGQAFRTYPEETRELLYKGLSKCENRFQLWHYSMLSHGVYLYLPPYIEAEDPFYFNFSIDGQGSLSSPHVIVMLDTGARATVILKTQSGNEERK